MIRNPVGRQYKGRKYADRYAAGLQVSWGGEQSDGSTVEVVVDTIETAEGRRYQVMAVTTPKPEPVVEHEVAPAGTQGTYSKGMSGEARVAVVGYKGGFTYVTFLDGSNKGLTSKVPSSWVEVDKPEPVSNETVKALKAAHVGQQILLGSGQYRISSISRRIYEPSKLDVNLEVLNAKGQVTARTWTVLSPAELAAKVL